MMLLFDHFINLLLLSCITPTQCYRFSARPLFPVQAAVACCFCLSQMELCQAQQEFLLSSVWYLLYRLYRGTSARPDRRIDTALCQWFNKKKKKKDCAQASGSTPPSPNYSLHLGPWVVFADVPTAGLSEQGWAASDTDTLSCVCVLCIQYVITVYVQYTYYCISVISYIGSVWSYLPGSGWQGVKLSAEQSRKKNNILYLA